MEVETCTAGLRRKEGWRYGPIEAGGHVPQFSTVEWSRIWTLGSKGRGRSSLQGQREKGAGRQDSWVIGK